MGIETSYRRRPSSRDTRPRESAASSLIRRSGCRMIALGKLITAAGEVGHEHPVDWRSLLVGSRAGGLVAGGGRGASRDRPGHAGWQMAHEILLPKLLPLKGQKEQYPGIAAFSADVEKAAADLNFKGEADKFPGIDCDALVTRNPNFWRANYEIAPGDPAWMMFHAGTPARGRRGRLAPRRSCVSRSRGRGSRTGSSRGSTIFSVKPAGCIADGKAAVKRGRGPVRRGRSCGCLETLRRRPQAMAAERDGPTTKLD